MNTEQQIVYADEKYKILSAEQEYIVHPLAFGLVPDNKASQQRVFTSEFHIEDYRLILDSITLTDAKAQEEQTWSYRCKTAYNGVVLLGANLVKEHYFKGMKLACFSYQKVLELVFENGMLITTVDQSKAMLRIRRNLELGLRSLDNSRDLRCIRRFMNASFVGDYKPFLLSYMRSRYLRDMQYDYENVRNFSENA